MAEIVKFEHMAANDEQYLTNAKIGKLLNQLGVEHITRTMEETTEDLMEQIDQYMKTFGVPSRYSEIK